VAFPVVALRRPAALAGQRNGELEGRILSPIDFAGGRLVSVAALSWLAMAAAARRAGITLAANSAHDAYRPLEVQRRIFLARYTLDAGRARRPLQAKRYLGRTYYLLPGFATAAVPGTSNHGWALAVDVDNASGARLDWLRRNAGVYGGSWELQSEPWHLRYYAGDAIPSAVTGGAPPPPIPTPTPTPPLEEDDDMPPLYIKLAYLDGSGPIYRAVGNTVTHLGPATWDLHKFLGGPDPIICNGDQARAWLDGMLDTRTGRPWQPPA
jgi:hypothetical protein